MNVLRKIVELAKYSWAMETSTHGYLQPPPIPADHQSVHYDLELEDWEKEVSGTRMRSYDPQKKCEKSSVIRRLQGATPSER